MQSVDSDMRSQGFIQGVQNKPLYKSLAAKRKRNRRIMMVIMMTIFFAVQLFWAFFPSVVNTTFPAGTPFSLAIWFTVIVVVVAILLSWVYAMVLGPRLDKINDELKKEVFGDG